MSRRQFFLGDDAGLLSCDIRRRNVHEAFEVRQFFRKGSHVLCAFAVRLFQNCFIRLESDFGAAMKDTGRMRFELLLHFF